MSDAIPFLAAEEDLAELLGDGPGLAVTAAEGATEPLIQVGVLTYVPEAVEPPVVIIQPAEDWLLSAEEDATFNPDEYVASVEVWAVVELVDNQSAARELRDLLASLVSRVGPSSWWIKSVGQPGPIHTSEWMNHGVRIVLARYVTA